MKITVDITDGELDAIEDLATVWLLCEKHKRATCNYSDEVKIFKVQQGCKDCLDRIKKTSGKALHAWSKIVHAYEIARYGKCDCGKR